MRHTGAVGLASTSIARRRPVCRRGLAGMYYVLRRWWWIWWSWYGTWSADCGGDGSGDGGGGGDGDGSDGMMVAVV